MCDAQSNGIIGMSNSFRIVKGPECYALREVLAIQPMPQRICWSPDGIRSLSLRGRETILSHVDATSYVMTRRVTGLPIMHGLWSQESGYALGYRRPKRISEPSQLYFLCQD